MNGIILIDKPKDYTSRDIVNIVGKSLNTKKVGHTGTLDPLATGLLVVAINDGLKIINLLNSDTKEYEVEVTLGTLTDTLDITGTILKSDNNFKLNKDELEKILKSFLGKLIQEVPIYSAVKVKGKKLYEYARNNEVVELPKKEIEIYNIRLTESNDNSFKFITTVSKGTYIRSLIRDIGLKLNILCTMSNLRRTKAGNFDIKDTITVDDIKAKNIKMIPVIDSLSNYKKIEVDSEFKKLIMNGRILENIYNDEIIVFTNNNQVIALYKIYDKDSTKIKPIKVFN